MDFLIDAMKETHLQVQETNRGMQETNRAVHELLEEQKSVTVQVSSITVNAFRTLMNNITGPHSVETEICRKIKDTVEKKTCKFNWVDNNGKQNEERFTPAFCSKLELMLFRDGMKRDCRVCDIHSSVVFNFTFNTVKLKGKTDLCISRSFEDLTSDEIIADAIFIVELKTALKEAPEANLRQIIAELICANEASRFAVEAILTDGCLWRIYSLARVSVGLRIHLMQFTCWEHASAYIIWRSQQPITESLLKSLEPVPEGRRGSENGSEEKSSGDENNNGNEQNARDKHGKGGMGKHMSGGGSGVCDDLDYQRDAFDEREWFLTSLFRSESGRKYLEPVISFSSNHIDK